MTDLGKAPAGWLSAIPARWRRWMLAVAATVVGLPLLLFALLHTPPARRLVLDQVVTLLEASAGVRLTASALDYNLAALRLSLRGVRIAAVETPDLPFLEAERLDIVVARSALRGRMALDLVRLVNARVVFVRRADGTSNLPAPQPASEPAGAPDAFPIGRLDVPRLTLDVLDETLDLAVTIPGLAVDLRPAGGTLRLLEPGRIRRGDAATTLTALGGGIGFDGRVFQLTDVALATGDATLSVAGRVALLVAEPRLDLTVSARADVPGLARFATPADVPTGALALDGAIAGPLATPSIIARLRSDGLTWDGLLVSDIRGEVTADAERVRIASFEATAARGRLTLSGDLALATTDVAMQAAWAELDLTTLTRALAPAAAPRPTGRASGTASVRGLLDDPSRLRVDARLRVAPVGAAPRQIGVSGAARLRLDDGAWRIEATPSLLGVPIDARLRGRLATPLAASSLGGAIAVREIDLPRLAAALGRVGLADIPEDTIAAGVLEARATLSGTLERPAFRLTAAARDLSARGVAELSAEITAAGVPARVAVEATLRQGGGNTIDASGVVWPEQQRAEARMAGRLADLGGLVPDTPVAGIVEIQFEGSGPFSRFEGKGAINGEAIRYGDVQLGTLAATVGIDADAVQADVTADAFSAHATARLGLDASRLVTVDLSVTDADLAALVRDLESPAAIAGRVSLRAHAAGPADEWRQGAAELEISSFDASVGTLPVRLANPATLSYRGEAFEVDGFEARVGETQLSIVGRLPVAAGAPSVDLADALRATVVGNLAQVLDDARQAGVDALPDLAATGPLALFVRVTGSADRPVIAADLELGPGGATVGELPPVTGLQLQAHLENGWLELRRAAAEWQQSRLSAEGRVPLRLLDQYLPPAVLTAVPPTSGDATLTARVEAITPQLLAPFMEADSLTQIQGTIDATFAASTATLNAEDLRGELRLDRFDVRLAALPIQQREPTRVIIDRGFARVAAWDWFGQGASLGVQGQVRLADRQAAILASGRIDLRTLTPFIRGAGMTAAGILTPRVSVTGSLADPRIDGDVTLASGEVRLRSPQVIATDLSARAVLSRSRAQVIGLSGVVNGGALDAGAELDYGPQTPLAARLAAKLTGMALEFPDGLRSELNADLAAAITDAPAGIGGSVTGTVTVVRSAYRDQIAVLTGVLSALRAERLGFVAAAEPTLLDRLALDVRVLTDGDVVVDNNLARVQVGGDLRVIGTAAAPSLSGRLELREGGRLSLGRNVYTLESGTIDFANPVLIEPNLNIQAQTRAGGETIEMTITGTPDDIDAELRSTTSPELGQADLVSLLLTGRRFDEVSGAEAQIVGEQVLGYLSGDLLGAASRAVGLDTIRLGGVDDLTLRRDPAAIAAQADPTSRVTFGKSLGELFEVTFSQSLRSNDAQTWILDYAPLPQVNLRLVSRDDKSRAYEFRHNISLGGPAGVRRPAADPRPVIEVTTVSLTGELGLPEERLRGALALGPGDRFDFAEWQRDRDRLVALLQRQAYREARVTARRSEEGLGVTLEYEIVAGPNTAVSVTGHALAGATMRELEQAWAESVFDEFLKAEVEAIVRQALADDRYLDPEVRVELLEADVKTLAIDIAAGERIADRRVAVDAAGDEAMSLALELWLRDERLDLAAWREPERVAQALVVQLRSQGYAGAAARASPIRIAGGTATLTFAVTPGSAVTIAEVRLLDTGAIDVAQLREAVGLEAGAAYDPVAVETARVRAVRAYRREGFGDARVSVQPAFDPAAGAAVVSFVVQPGPRQILREILVRGADGISTGVVTRALDLTVGDPLGAEAWLAARARVFDTALFRRVDVTANPIEEVGADAAEQPMRVTVTVQQWPAVRLRYGLQLSEERPEEDADGTSLAPGLSADVTRRTVFGRAITVGGAVELQRRERLGRLFANAPTLFGAPIESLVTLQRSAAEFADATFVTERTGVSWEQRIRVASRLRLSFNYRFERNRTYDTDPTPNPNFPQFDVTVNIGRLTGAAVYDSRDNPIDSTRGMFLSSNVEYAPRSLGSEIQFVRHLGQAYHFRRWRGVVLASAARLGLAAPLGGQSLILSERFYSGGPTSVRGLAQDGLGPRNGLGEAAGGNALTVLNQEVRFPLFRWVRGVGFGDAGNVFANISDVSLTSLVGAYGAGLRITTPLALVRVDYARLWSPTPEQSSGRWIIGIGQAF